MMSGVSYVCLQGVLKVDGYSPSEGCNWEAEGSIQEVQYVQIWICSKS